MPHRLQCVSSVPNCSPMSALRTILFLMCAHLQLILQGWLCPYSGPTSAHSQEGINIERITKKQSNNKKNLCLLQGWMEEGDHSWPHDARRRIGPQPSVTSYRSLPPPPPPHPSPLLSPSPLPCSLPPPLFPSHKEGSLPSLPLTFLPFYDGVQDWKTRVFHNG